MTAKYFAILTNYGAAQLANAVALGTQINISAMAVGDGGGTLPVPDPAQTKLIRENRRAAVNQVSIDEKNPNFIIAEQVIPENEGGWFIREIGLFDDKGGLIAVGNAPETYKPNLQEGSGRTQVIQIVLMVSSTQAITLKIDPSVVLATREYVTKSVAAAIQESEARAAQTYQPKGDYVLNPYFKLEMLKKLDKADVVNQLGNDTGKAASQHLLTTEIGKLQPKGNYQPAGNYASGQYFYFVGDSYTAMQSPNRSYRASVSESGSFSVTEDKTSTSIVAFDKTGEMIRGVIPLSRIPEYTKSIPGIDQSWRDVTGERSANIEYPNNTGKPITVSVTTYSGQRAQIYISGVEVAASRNGLNAESYTDITMTVPVPTGGRLKIIGEFNKWRELRS